MKVVISALFMSVSATAAIDALNFASPDELAEAITKTKLPQIGSKFDWGRESSDE